MSIAQASAGLAITIAEGLLDPHRVLAADPVRPAASLQGLAGTALLHARLSAVSPVFEAAARSHWHAAAAHAPRRRTTSSGTFAAPGGLATSLILGESYLPDPEPQRQAVRHAVRWLSARTADKAATHQDLLRQGPVAPSWALYDVITGLTGSGRILLAAQARGHDHAERGLVAALTTLQAMINTPQGDTRPGWWLPPGSRPNTAGFPAAGAAETGMAHGIAGPLSLIATAASAGWSVDGQATAIRTAAHWLLKWQDPDTKTWPPHITGTELDSGNHAPSPPAGRRDAWCYGTPGISRALALAGHALADPRLASAATAALDALAARPATQWDASGPALCHGYAGVLHCAGPGHDPLASQAATIICAKYRNCGEPGFLTGAAGTALALADHGGLPARADPVRWDAALLLS